MEPNLSGVGGIHFGPLAEELVMRDVVPTMLAHDPDLAIELPRDQRELFLQVLLDHASAIGRRDGNLCFIEPKYELGGTERATVACAAPARQARRHRIVHADPRELRMVGDEVYYEDVRIDVAYRDYEVRDLIALEATRRRRPRADARAVSPEPRRVVDRWRLRPQELLGALDRPDVSPRATSPPRNGGCSRGTCCGPASSPIDAPACRTERARCSSSRARIARSSCSSPTRLGGGRGILIATAHDAGGMGGTRCIRP